MLYQLAVGEEVGNILVAVEAEAAPYAAAFGPGAVALAAEAGAVFGRAEAVLRAAAPAVIDYGIGANGVVVPADKLRRAELLGAVQPVAVGENEVGTVAADELLELRNHIVVDIVANLLGRVLHPDVARVAPFGQRIVEAHPEPLAAHGGGEFLDDVAARAADGAVPRGLLGTVPQAVAVVVLGDENHVARPGVAEQLRPFIGLPQLCFPVLCQFGILLEDGQRGVGIEAHNAAAPAVARHQAAVEPLAVALLAGVGRHAVEAPMDEYAQSGVAEPLRVAALVD